MSYLNSDNALLLAKKLEEIPNVKQVRFNYVLHDGLKDKMGANAVVYNCLVESLEQNHPNVSTTLMERFTTVIDENNYENVDNHGFIQAAMNERIGHYLRTGEKLENVGSFSYPFTVDADGNRISYDLFKSNAPR